MPVIVKIPTQLRSLTAGAGEVETSAGRLAWLIDDLEARYPGFRQRLLDEAGSLRRFINVYVADEDVRFLDGLATDVNDGDVVAIIPAVAGG